MLIQIVSVVTPIFLITALGFLWARREQPFDNATISSLVMYIGTPSLVFHSLTSLKPELQELQTLGFASLAAITLCLIVGYVGLKIARLDLHAFLPALTLANTGNMGLPLVMLTFGDAGLAMGVVVFFVHSLAQNSLGLAISSGSFHPKTLIQQPILWAVILACITLISGFTVPDWLANTTRLLGGLLIPAMLLMLGTSLARLSLKDLPQALALAIARMLLGVSAALLLIWALELEGVAAGVLFLQAAMPIAVFNYVFADRFNRRPNEVAATVLVSTLISMAALPFLVAISIGIANP